MEETDLVREQGRPGALGRLAAKAAVLAALAFLLGWFAGGIEAAAGASVGGLAAGLYAWGYIRSHLSRARRERLMDSKLFGSSAARMGVFALVTAGVWLLGRTSFLAYLLAFGVSFAVLLATEAPRVMRALRADGLIGGSG